MKQFDVWMEGFQVMEGQSPAKFLGTYFGKNFLDACKKAAKHHPEYGEYDSEENSIYGCRLFNNELLARRNFG